MEKIKYKCKSTVKELIPKLMTRQEFEKLISKYEWTPASISYEHLPEWAKDIHEEMLYFMLVSDKSSPAEEEIGGYKIGRNVSDDGQCAELFDKKHYVVLIDDNNGKIVIITGTFRDHEHFLKDLLKKFKNAPRIYEVNRDKESESDEGS